MWTLILSIVLKGLDLAMGKVQADATIKKAYVDFLTAVAPEFAKTAKTFLSYQGMQADLDTQKAAIKEQEGKTK